MCVRELCVRTQLLNSSLDANPDRHFGTNLLLCLIQSSCSDDTNALRRETGTASVHTALKVNGKHVGELYSCTDQCPAL